VPHSKTTTVDLILGTAGHIDHGKTALVKALTGVDTDRLPEEKRRGITIELGFAELVLDNVRLGIIDVPGHERFVRNMLAGATGIDLAMLVVAADDSVKPQTREHLEILRLLDLRAGVIVLTKCDLAEADWIDLVEAEVRELVQGTFLERAPLVRTSAHAGEGIGDLRATLRKVACEAVPSVRARESCGPFRMAIDRSFSVTGHGTVVTGSVLSGQAVLGEKLVLEPGSVSVRVRGLQNHDRVVDSVHRGQRAAVNIAGIHHDQIVRGQELATPEYLVPSRLFSVRLDLLASAPRPLKTRARVRVHVGTAELLATVTLLEADSLRPGERGYAQLFLSQPAVATWNQPFVIRSESPVTTIGGGVVLDPVAQKVRRGKKDCLDSLTQLASADAAKRAAAALYFSGWRAWRAQDLTRTAGIQDVDPVLDKLRESGDLCLLEVSPTRTIAVHREVLEQTMTAIEKAVRQCHAQNPLVSSFDRSPLVKRFEFIGSAALVEALLAHMVDLGRIVRSGDGIALADHGPRLTAGEKQLLDAMVEQIEAGAFQPPTISEIQAQATRNRAVIPQLATLAAAQGRLVHVSGEIFLHPSHAARLPALLSSHPAAGQGLTVSQIREILNTSRKYAVPICQYLDNMGLTRRAGDLRVLGSVSLES
jgi:selenocysteine-specific elongation factor